jgi:CMP-N-acetylneuraminate monooxygenase
MKICLGPVSLLDSKPKLLNIKDGSYLLSKNSKDEPILFDTICPHMGGEVKTKNNETFQCPSHCWTFDSSSGCGVSNTSHLISYYTYIKNNLIYADIPSNEIRSFKFSDSSNELPKISLISHACLLIEWDGFRLLTDPWIEGSAFLGAWELYPPPTIKVKDLPPIDAIWISHEHSDHFNIKTLSQLKKNIPVYVSSADNQRLVQKLKALNFQNVIAVDSYQKISLKKGFTAISFKSKSIWNDNILYLQLGKFSILNVNDAGFNWELKKIFPKVDLVCSTFSFGASGYPLTWTHLSTDEKIKIIDKTNQEKLRYIKKVCNNLNAKYFLPFASYFTLPHAYHKQYRKSLKLNRPNDIIDYLKDSSTTVLDILPGESWDANTDKILFRPDHSEFFKEKYENKLISSSKEYATENILNDNFKINSRDIIKYFSSFSGSELAKQVGELSISLSAMGNKKKIHILIRFINGKVICRETQNPTNSVEMTMVCPGFIIQQIIQEDLSWDEASIGYWCVFSRNPDVYNTSLWKLFYAPWKARIKNLSMSDVHSSEALMNWSIGDIVENLDKSVVETMENYGLYCVGCNTAMAETLQEGCNIHGISKESTLKLVEKLKKILRKKNGMVLK